MHLPKTFLVSFMLYVAMPAYAQGNGPSTLDAAGKSSTVGGITHEYALGQVVAGNTYTSSSLVVTPGVLQPAGSTTGIGVLPITSANLQIYPSPVETTLYLQPSFTGSGSLEYMLYDAAGKLLLNQTASLKSGKERQALSVTGLAAGQYMLQVTWQQAGKVFTSGYQVRKLR